MPAACAGDRARSTSTFSTMTLRCAGWDLSHDPMHPAHLVSAPPGAAQANVRAATAHRGRAALATSGAWQDGSRDAGGARLSRAISLSPDPVVFALRPAWGSLPRPPRPEPRRSRSVCGSARGCSLGARPALPTQPWTSSVSPSRAYSSAAFNCGRWVSLPLALSVKVRSTPTPSSWRSVFWSTVLTRT